MHFLSLTYISEYNPVPRPIPSVHLKIPFRREKFHHSLEKKSKKNREKRSNTISRNNVPRIDLQPHRLNQSSACQDVGRRHGPMESVMYRWLLVLSGPSKQRFILSSTQLVCVRSFFLPFFRSFSVPPLPSCLVSITRGPPFCIAAADECETSTELLQPVSARRSIVRHVALQTVDTEQRDTTIHTRAFDKQKGEKTREKNALKRRRSGWRRRR